MKKNPLVSVIMNCHNGELYLKKSLKSLINQSYKNWELIFYDNKSSDDTNLIVKNFCDSRIKYYKSSKFEKLYTARNQAIKKCKGELICFLDVDDWWVKDKLLIQVNQFKKDKNLKILYCNFCNYIQKKKRIICPKNKLPSGAITQSLLNNYSIGILTVMLKKSIFKKNKFNGSYNIIGDFDFFINLSLKYNIQSLNNRLAIYRVHSNNYSIKNMDEYRKEILRWLNPNKKKLKKFKHSLLQMRVLFLKILIKRFFRL